MALVINNTQQVKDYASQLATNAEKISSVQYSIDYILNELAEYWEQTQEDAQTFATGLKNNSSNLETIVECNKEFAVAIENYINATESTASTTVSGVSLDTIQSVNAGLRGGGS